MRVARELGRHAELCEVLVDGAFGLSRDEFKSRILEACMEAADNADVILFAQGSMAYCEKLVEEKTGKPTLSSPRFGALAVKNALAAKGLIKMEANK